MLNQSKLVANYTLNSLFVDMNEFLKQKVMKVMKVLKVMHEIL